MNSLDHALSADRAARQASRSYARKRLRGEHTMEPRTARARHAQRVDLSADYANGLIGAHDRKFNLRHARQYLADAQTIRANGLEPIPGAPGRREAL